MNTKHMSDLAQRSILMNMLDAPAAMSVNGNDLTKRNAAIEAICGPSTNDGKQTRRLLKLALAIVEARL